MPTSKTSSRPSQPGLSLGVLAGAVLLFPALAPAASISEPDTVLFGRIINRSGGAEQVVTAGSLVWTVRGPGVASRTYSTALERIEDGAYSYRLHVPHSLVGTGLQPASGALPLTVDETSYSFGEILVDGVPATIDADSGSAIPAKQDRRGQALRIDLELRQPMADADADGMPDWWEIAHGLDPYTAANAGADGDGDGLTNLAEWRAGSSPTQDNRVPSLARMDLSVYPTGLSGLALRVLDTDTDPASIALILTAIPADGELVVRNGSGGRVLRRGDFFTAAEARDGLVQFRRNAEPAAALHSVILGLAIVDRSGPGSPTSPGWVFDEASLSPGVDQRPVMQEVRLRLVSDAIGAVGTAAEALVDSAVTIPGLSESSALRAKASFLAQHHRVVVWDALDHPTAVALRAISGASTPEQYAAGNERRYGPDVPVFMLGGDGNDTLEGGFGPDVLFGGRGDDTLIGNLGADRFVIGRGAILTRVRDFNPDEGDQLDLSRLFSGKSGPVDEFLQFSAEPAGGSTLRLFDSPTHNGEPMAVVRFESFAVTFDELPELAASGALLLGGMTVVPMLSVVPVESGAENGLKPARVAVRRSGDLGSDLVVGFSLSGSATPGVDYQTPPPSIVIRAGQSEAEIIIRPYNDGLSESDESVRVTLLAGPGYRVGSNAGAELVIRDLVPEFFLTSIRAEASFDPSNPAVIRVNRTGLIDRQVVLELRWTGQDAIGWVDALPAFLDFGRGETTRLIEVRPKQGSAKPAIPLVLSLRLAEHPSYIQSDPAWASVTLVPRSLDFEDWASPAFPGNPDPGALAVSDPEGIGMSLLERFAFSLTPRLPDLRSSTLPRVVERNGRYGVEFVIQPGAQQVKVDVQLSPDLKQWGGGSTSLIEVPPASGAVVPPGWRRFEPVGPSSNGPRFFHVKLTLNP